ncbi:MAG: hypothetical protein HRU01_24985 [Myxococcales bacterium]|nr:hypothetical protein [Myxococcales bacterium]
MRSRALFAALLATLAAWIAAPSVTAQADAQKIRVALLPVAVHTSNTDTGYLSSGIADMLSSRLERSSRVSVRRVSDPERATTDLPTALRLAREVDADFVLFGSFTQFGAGASLDIRCAPVPIGPDGDADAARRIFIQSGTLEEIIPKLDDLSDKVARYIERGAPPRAVAERGSEPAAAPPADDTVAELRERIRALEQAVFDADVEIAAPAESN